MIKKEIETSLPTEYGDFQIAAFKNIDNIALPHIVLFHKEMDVENAVMVRIHSECFTGDVFGSKKCDCGDQLHAAMDLIQQQKGIIIYLRQEGRGIGLVNKLKAYELQSKGLDTVEANVHLGFEPDERHYDIAIDILQSLAITKVDLLTNNPLKVAAITNSSIELHERIPLLIQPNKENKPYFETKRDSMGHIFDFDL
jgi:3,4-dihydroxy 2-butanone 4-phosphate synthase / GTP cyclohydrolase II